MNVYKATFKEGERESYWDNKPLLVVAANYANAEQKALSYSGYQGRELLSIILFGETTGKTDIFKLRGNASI